MFELSIYIVYGQLFLLRLIRVRNINIIFTFKLILDTLAEPTISARQEAVYSYLVMDYKLCSQRSKIKMFNSNIHIRTSTLQITHYPMNKS